MTTIDEHANILRPRDKDGSLSPKQRSPRRVSPDSLLWKYQGDTRALLLMGRVGTTENMYPQLGQAVSDHSVIFTSLFERVRRSTGPIANSLYGPTPEKTAIQVRNYHKPLNGTVDDGSKYHGTEYRGLDPETFYWAHATFVDNVMTTVERFIKPLSDAEKEQLYSEFKDWYSLWGVEDTFQPATYAEFKEYWDRTVRDELIGDSKVAQFTVGYISKGITRAFPKTPRVPPLVWAKILAPSIDRVASFLGAGGLDPALREKLGVPWSDAQEARYRRVCAVIRALGPVWERYAPLKVRYGPQAVAGFERENIDPRTINAKTNTR